MEESQILYGICHLSVVPIRAEADDKAEITSQLLFGEIFTISKSTEDNKWCYIETAYDEYIGWIDTKQFVLIDELYYRNHYNNPHPLSKGLIGLVKFDNKYTPVLMGSTLPFYKDGLIKIGEKYFNYEGEYFYPSIGNAKNVEITALFYLSAPYLWGGRNHFGIDCSGFVQQVFKFNGITLPRDAYKQAEIGETIPFNKLEPGDIVYFHNVSGRVIHVGIALPENKIIHASGEVRIDLLDETGIFNLNKKQYSHKLHSVKRVLNR